jgi:molybdopterin converting factor subunit 1
VRLNVRLFAMARERVGRAEVALDLPEPTTVTDLRRALAVACPGLAPFMPSLMIAVNSEYVPDDLKIPPGSDVAVIPPVSGGQPESTLSRRSRSR